MRRNLALVLLVLLAGPALADTITATVTVAAGQKARLTKKLARINATNCAAVQLPATCTDAQAKAVRADLTIFPDLDSWASAVLKDVAKSALQSGDDDEAAEVVAAWRALSPAEQATAKAALKLP